VDTGSQVDLPLDQLFQDINLGGEYDWEGDGRSAEHQEDMMNKTCWEQLDGAPSAIRLTKSSMA
jgi:hypothetical protein